MAVVQISRIQIRRGQKNGGTGLPQLASGEMAWAIDTQELYIGNGAVSEGSPGVGNTKIITQKDLTSENNLFGLVQYVYKTDEELTVKNNAPVTRTLQARLDDQVVTTDFGTLGTYDADTESGADDTDALQFAIDQLFLNSANKASDTEPASVSSRVILSVPAGTFKISRTLYVPSYTTLIGAGMDKTIIRYKPAATTLTGSMIISSDSITNINATADMVGSYITGDGIPVNTSVLSVNETANTMVISQGVTATATGVSLTITVSGPAIQFVNDTSSAGAPSPLSETQGVTQPKNIQLSGLTIKSTTDVHTCLKLDAVKNSLFEDMRIEGTSNSNYDDRSSGLSLFAKSSLVTCENNIFRNLIIINVNYGVYTKHDISNNIFENCTIANAKQGFGFAELADGLSSGEEFGPSKTQIIGCKFNDIVAHAVYIKLGTGNIVSNITMVNVGSEQSGNTDPDVGIVRYPQVYFGNHGNFANNIVSDREELETDYGNVEFVYAPIVSGSAVYKSNTTRSIYISGTSGNLMRLPVVTSSSGVPEGTMSYSIDYFFKNTAGTNYQRSGTILIAVDVDNRELQLSDEYNYAVAGVQPIEDAELLDISAEFLDKTGVAYDPLDPLLPYSILLKFTNLLSGTQTGHFVYTFTAHS